MLILSNPSFIFCGLPDRTQVLQDLLKWIRASMVYNGTIGEETGTDIANLGVTLAFDGSLKEIASSWTELHPEDGMGVWMFAKENADEFKPVVIGKSYYSDCKLVLLVTTLPREHDAYDFEDDRELFF